MNILILNSTSDLYGSSKILVFVLQALIKNGHRPVVVVSESGPLVSDIEKLGVKVHIIRLGILRRKYFTPAGMVNRLQTMVKAWGALSKIIDDEKIEAIYSNTTAVLIGAFIAKRRKLKHVWHVHEIITSPRFFSKFIGFLLKTLSDDIIVVSDAVADHWVRFTGKDKLRRIYNGIDCSPFENADATLKSELGMAPDVHLVGMIGRVNHWKGQSYFLQIAKELLLTHPETKIVMAGDAFPGSEHLVDELLDEIKSSDLLGKVYFLGFRQDTPNLLQSFDVFVLPSILPDPFPTVILEAMASSTPVAATCHGGANEMIDHQATGVLIPFNDYKQAAALIRPLLNSAEMRKQFGDAANARIHRLFSQAAFESAIASIF